MRRLELSFLVPVFVLGGAGCSVALGIDGEYEDCTCGDGVVCSIEACDDGNTSDADNCSSTCVLREVVEVTAGGQFTCARLNDGSVKCWGSNDYGQLGLDGIGSRGDDPGEMGSHLLPVNLGMNRTAVRIAAGYENTCAILDNGKVRCWGRNGYGQLGSPGAGPADLDFDERAVAIGAGYAHTCAIFNDSNVVDGSVMCWGRNEDGQLGAGDISFSAAPRPVDLGAGNTAVAIALGAAHTCALLKDKTVKCWGSNEFGQLGLGLDDKLDKPKPEGPVNLGAGKSAIGLAAGFNHTCALLSDYSLLCWGRNDWGRLGLGDETARISPSGPVAEMVASITAGEAHSCAILRDGSLDCWGYNNNGQVGAGDTGNHLLPSSVKLGEDKKASAIAAGQYHTCAILSDGSLKCWGSNGFGRLGLGDESPRGQKASEMGDNLLPVKLFSEVW
ncbi:MAG: hypothetical protein HUU21_19775 [Polyangiaceae bacterium]|nr:hypothetical protein [Polyangiaceae bacterium]